MTQEPTAPMLVVARYESFMLRVRAGLGLPGESGVKDRQYVLKLYACVSILSN